MVSRGWSMVSPDPRGRRAIIVLIIDAFRSLFSCAL
jgi:hypothetical protein